MSYKIINFLAFTAFCDAAEPWQLGFQDPATPSMEGMIDFHNYIMIFVITIGLFVLWMLYQVFVFFNEGGSKFRLKQKNFLRI